MTRQSTIVRCTLCGFGIEVALAIGQMLKCPSCGTTFMAPTEDPGQARAGHENVDPLAESAGVSQAADPLLGTPGSPTAATVSAAALPIGSGTPGGQREPHATPTAETAEPPPAEDELDDTSTTRRRLLSRAAMIAGSCLALMAAVAVLPRLRSGKSASVSQAKATPEARPADDSVESTAIPFPVRYSPALQRAQRIGHVRVHVTRVRYAPVVAKTHDNSVTQTGGSRFLQIELELQNRSSRPVTYRSWYGNTFQWDNRELAAMLTDQSGRRWPLVVFDDARAIEGHTPQAVLEPRDRIRDVLVFEPPDAEALSMATSWRLFLPAIALDRTGGFGFVIDAANVRGLAERNPE